MKKMSGGFVFSSHVRDADHRLCGCCGIKGFVSQGPRLCLHRAHHRYSGKRGCRIIHDWRGHPLNAHSNWNKVEHLGVTGLKQSLSAPPGTDSKAAAQFGLFASSTCLFWHWSLLCSQNKNVTLCFCL